MQDTSKETSKEIIQKQINFYNNRISSLLLNFSEDKIRNFDNHLLSKIFEYYACIILTEKYKRIFECYDFILPDKKLELQLSSNDNGIDLCDLENTICQVKLYSNCITWKCLSTFLAQQIGYDNERKEAYVKWKNMFLFRNEESHLSNKFPENSIKIMKQELCKRSEFIEYIVDLVNKEKSRKEEREEVNEEGKKEVKDKVKEKVKNKVILRKYQKECKDILINSNNENVVLCLPTGTGKTLICISYMKSVINESVKESLNVNQPKFLILVPTCQLLDQWYKEVLRFHAKPKDICRIDHEYSYDLDREYKIYICVYNSISKVLEKVKAESFKKIIIDEAHHIRKPEIYKEEDEEDYYDEDEGGGEEEYDEGREEEEYEDDESIYSSSLSSSLSSSKTSSSNISFTEIISHLRKYNNVIEISATIDKPISGLYYKYDLRRAIDEGYISDYQIIIPIFSDHPDDSVIANYLIRNGVNHCIIFSKCKEEGKKFQTLMNETLENCCAYIDSDTKRKERERILKDFEEGKIRFIVNIRILSEGFNSIVAESCVFLHMSSNDTFIIQSIGRILRKSEKKISNVYLPYSNMEEGDNINRIIRIMSETDYKLNEQYKKKSIGGMLNFNYVKEEEEDVEEDWEESDEEEGEEDEVEMNDILHKYDIIYNSFGESNSNNYKKFYERLEKLKEYICREMKRPSNGSKDKNEKFLAGWLHHKSEYYKKQIYIMKNEDIRETWKQFISDERYKIYFLSNEQQWISNLEKVKNYIDSNNKKPSIYSNDPETKSYHNWITNQLHKYKKKQQIMKNEEIRKSWEDFIESYPNLFNSS
jgi:superfamily II DNA/RNA helicase